MALRKVKVIITDFSSKVLTVLFQIVTVSHQHDLHYTTRRGATLFIQNRLFFVLKLLNLSHTIYPKDNFTRGEI